MRVTLSFATTADGFLDDTAPQRLVISTPEDWAAVHRLRAQCDAILIGAETLRRDNPALLLRDEALRARRAARGVRPDLTRVVVTASGRLDPALRLFTEGAAERIVFAPHDLPALHGVATVIASDGPLTARFIVTELEKRGFTHLLVEGGAQILRMFLAENMADTVRCAVNPALTPGPNGRAPFCFVPPPGAPCVRELLGGMEVTTCTLHPDTAAEDRRRLLQAIEASRQSPPCATAYRVGAVIVTRDGAVFTGCTHEHSATHHAEQEAILKALAAGADLRGASAYSSMEPCSHRSSEPESCTQLLIRYGFAHVAFALHEPDRFVQDCRGAQLLREAGIDVRAYPDLGGEVLAINGHLWR